MLHDLKSFSAERYDDGSYKVSYDGSLVVIPLIEYNSLLKRVAKAEETKERLVEETKENGELVDSLVQYTTLDWYEEHKGSKKGCGRLADAMMLADAVRGMTFAEIKEKRYPYKKNGTKKYGRDKIFEALSVKKPDDPQRIKDLLMDYPEVFSSVSVNDVYLWMQKKLNKGVKR